MSWLVIVGWTLYAGCRYDVRMVYANGTTKRVDHRERPTLITDEAGALRQLAHSDRAYTKEEARARTARTVSSQAQQRY